jgi:hypothetical protein
MEKVEVKKLEFPVDKPLWDLWDLLEGHRVKEVLVEAERESEHPEIIDVYIYKDTATLVLPAWILASFEAYDFAWFFAHCYTDFHTDLDAKIRDEAKALVRDLAGAREPPEKLREATRSLYEEIKRQIKEIVKTLDTFTVFSYSLAEIARRELTWLKGE